MLLSSCHERLPSYQFLAHLLVQKAPGIPVAATPDTPLTTEELHAKVLAILPGPEQKLLRLLLEIYPEEISKDELAERSGYVAGAGGFNNPCGRLRTLGLVEYPGPGKMKAKSLLFL
jgi:hypothetical protein